MKHKDNIVYNQKIVKGLAKGIKKVSAYNEKHFNLSRIIKLTDYSFNELKESVNKLTAQERADMLRAATDINRVLREIQNSELSAHADRNCDRAQDVEML